MSDGNGLAEKMLGLSGLVVLDVEDVPGEVVVTVETTRREAFCASCRKRAQAQDRIEVQLRDLHCYGRACRLVIRKRRWRCRTAGRVKKTWTEQIAGIASRQVLTMSKGLRSLVRWDRSAGPSPRSLVSTASLGTVPSMPSSCTADPSSMTKPA